MSRNHVRTATLALGFALSALVLTPTVTATASSSAPQLGIAIDDGEASADAGETRSYVITVDNLGDSRVKALRVSQTLPDGLVLVSADHQGVQKAAGVAWSVDLAPGAHTTLHTTVRVGDTPDDLLRLATVACATLTPTKAPLVCATDSDELAAGAAARVSATAEERGSQIGAGTAGLSTPQAVGLAALVLMLAAGLGGFAYWTRSGHAAAH